MKVFIKEFGEGKSPGVGCSSHVNSSLKFNQILNAYLQSTFLVAIILV